MVAKKRTRNKKGSVLVFAMLVLSMLLSIAVSGMMVVVATKNSSRATERSALAFQVADGAVENVLKRVYKDTDLTLTDLESRLHGSSTPCAGGAISGSLPSSDGTYTVKFLDNDNNSIGCNDGGWRAKLVQLEAVGTYAGTTRAVKVGVTPP
jgi:Tfp pilus assembly protein PilX